MLCCALGALGSDILHTTHTILVEQWRDTMGVGEIVQITGVNLQGEPLL